MPQRKPETRIAVATALRERILKGEWGPGAQLPTVRDLAAELKCSHVTAHAALRILASEGLILVRPRHGSLVAIPQQSIAGPTERMHRSRTQRGLFRPGDVVEFLTVDLLPGHPDAAGAFGIDEDEPMGLREYLVRNSYGTVITYGRSYVHPEVWALVPELRAREAIPDGIIGAIGRVLDRWSASPPPTHYMSAEASEQEAAMLGVPVGAPVLVAVTECLQPDGMLLEWNLSVHPSKHWIGA